MQRLNWGSAFDIHEGWINSDLIDYGQEHVGDVLDGLPFEDNYFDYIVANHTLQMVRFHDLPQALAELRRVLKPGGTLRILVPDANKAIRARRLEDIDYFPISDDVEETPDGKFLRYLFWHGDARSAFTGLSLISTLHRNGFHNAYRLPFKATMSSHTHIIELDSREKESIIMEATK